MHKIMPVVLVIILLCSVFTVSVPSVHAGYVDISIDGNFSDWSGVPVLVSDPQDQPGYERYDISECYMANSPTYVFIRIDRFAQGGESYALAMRTYLDTDRNSATGYSIHGIGADYYLVFSYGDPGHNQLWERSGSEWVFKTDVPFAFGSAGSRYGYETRLYHGWIDDSTGMDVIFWVHNTGDYAPDSGYATFFPFPTAYIEDARTDKSEYQFGDTITLEVNVDTYKDEQNIKWVAELFDPDDVRRDYSLWQHYTVYDAVVDYRPVDLDIPNSGKEGNWRIKITVADDDTHEDEDKKSIYRQVSSKPVPDFDISVSPTSGTVQQGGSTTATVTVTQIEGYSKRVKLSASGQPSGVTVTFSPESGYPTFTSTMDIQVASYVVPDTYPITITGEESGIILSETIIQASHSTPYTLTVTAAPPPQRTISLKSKTTDGLDNIGTITFDGVTYTSPNSLQKEDGSYTALANPPGSYSFHHWEYTGGVSASDKYANPTQVYVSGNGELTVVFFYDIQLVFSVGESYYPVEGLSYDGDSDITNNYANYDEVLHGLRDLDQDGKKDVPAYVYKTVDGSYSVLEYWIYYAYDNKKIVGLPLWRHEHDFESVYLWIDSNYVITKISLNQHQWTNNYWTAIPRKIYIGVEEGGHGMLMLDSNFETVKPDNSDLKPGLSGTFSGSSEKATLYPWKTYTGSPLDDGFGDSRNLSKARWETGPFPFLGTAHVDASIFFPLISIDIVNIGWNVYKSITDPILLISSDPVDDWFFTSILYNFYITAPWVRREFGEPSKQSIRLSYSHWNVKTWAKFIVNWASLGLKETLLQLVAGTAVKFVAFGIPHWLGVINDPANLTIVDSEGNILGYKDGQLVSELPGGIILSKSQNYEIYFISNNATNFEYSILGQAPQTYNFTVRAAWFNETVPDVSFNATNIPLEATSEHVYEMDWLTLRQAGNGTSIDIDQDGDGVYEQTIQTGTTLTSDQIGGGYAYTDKSQYEEGETVTVGFQNTGSTTITLPTTAPWVIFDSSMNIVYRATGAMILVDVGPGEKKEWQWDQKDDFGQQVPLGTYFFQIETSAGNFTASFSITTTPVLYSLPAGKKHWEPSYPTLDNTTLLIDINIMGSGQVFNTTPGQTISGNCTYQIYSGSNPNEIKQAFFIMSWTPSWPPQSGYYIPIYDSIPGLYPGDSGTVPFSLTAPSTPGTYYLYWCGDSHYSMEQAVGKYEWLLNLPAHAKIIVGSHDVAVTNVTPSKTVVGQGYSLNISVAVENQGLYTETFKVTVFSCNFSHPTSEQWETFWSMGDVNSDGYIDDIDGDLINATFGLTPGDPNWNPDADLNQDGRVNILDAVIYKNGYGLIIWTYFNLGTVINNQTVVDLSPGTPATLTIPWNTTGTPKGNYTIKAYAHPVPGETDTANNTNYADKEVCVTFPGDVNGDRKVRIDDVLAIALAFGSDYGEPRYDPNLDVNCDQKIRVDDVLTAAMNFGWP